MPSSYAFRIATVLALITLAPVALAHQQGAVDSGALVSGFMHPFGGIDHLLAMLAVGMWGAQLGRPALWMLPVAFPMLMAAGGVLGIAGIPFPSVELGIALSVVVLGAVILLNARPPLAISLAIVSGFALFHGYAHGVELPSQADPLPYSFGFVLATGLIHLAGIAIGLITHLPRGLAMLRAGGAAIAATGVWLLVGL
ncbi:MAG: HupE/UreJ family protein [Chromatiales bacterium]|nr:HupE/UreJ family protein [Chromatiales bacterium]